MTEQEHHGLKWNKHLCLKRKSAFLGFFLFFMREQLRHTPVQRMKAARRKTHDSASAFDCSALIAALPSPEEPIGEGEVN